MAHTALREIVERAVEEARKLPGLGGSGGTGKAPEARNVAEHSYEDVLATAILNKVAKYSLFFFQSLISLERERESENTLSLFLVRLGPRYAEFVALARESSERG